MRRRDRRLGPVRRLLLAGEILRVYATVRRLLRRHTLVETLAELRRPRPPGHRPADDASTLALARHLAWATVRTITLLPADSRCLMRSLVLSGVLARRGVNSTFVLSAAPAPRFEAHAWVECDGEPLLVPAGADHRQLVRL